MAAFVSFGKTGPVVASCFEFTSEVRVAVLNVVNRVLWSLFAYAPEEKNEVIDKLEWGTSPL